MSDLVRCETCASDRLRVVKTQTYDTHAERVVVCENGHETTIRQKLAGHVWKDGHWNTIEAAEP